MSTDPNDLTPPERIAAWLQPLDGTACGDDLEYDPAFLELEQAAAGKPETQFAPAEPPLWPQVLEQAGALLDRSRDLRLALMWSRAALRTDGLSAMPAVLALMHGLLDAFWHDGLHPALDPDDGDAFARINVVSSFEKLEGLLGDTRQAVLNTDRRLGGLQVRDVEIAMDRLPPRPDESPRTLGEMQGLLGDMPALAEQIRFAAASSLAHLKQLQRVMNDRMGMDQAVDVKPLRVMLQAVADMVPAPAPQGEAAQAGDDSDAAQADSGDEGDTPRGGGGGGGPRGGGLGRIDSRKDAVRAINLVCEYLERSEPTNPAQLLLRRAERLIDKNFLQLVRDLAPDALAEVARIMGVDADSLGQDS